jgi:nucleotide-binding universal stress UspA family protein
MSTFTVMLHTAAENLDPDRGPASYALGLAVAFEAHLTGIVVQLDASSAESADRASGQADLEPAVERGNSAARTRAEQLKHRAQSFGVTVELLTNPSQAYTVPHVVADHARLCDVAVAGVTDTGLLSERSIAEYVLFQSGRPLIVVPQRYDGPFACRRVTVAWDFERTAARALGDALPFLRRAAEVTLLTVDADKAIDTSLTTSDVLTSLQRRGIRARLEQIERQGQSIGDAIQQYALLQDSDLLVMGGYGHSRFRDFVLGGATRQILASPRLPTLLSH